MIGCGNWLWCWSLVVDGWWFDGVVLMLGEGSSFGTVPTNPVIGG